VKLEECNGCYVCGCEDVYTKDKGPHTGIYCNKCDKWLGWLTKDILDWKNYKMPFGLHKGVKISDVPIDYIKWAKENIEDERLNDIFEKAWEEFKPKIIPSQLFKVTDDYGKIIFEGEARNLIESCSKIWENCSMIHPSFMYSEGSIVGIVEKI